MTQDAADNATTVQRVREAAGPAHPLAVLLGRGLLRSSRLSRKLIPVKKQRQSLTAAGAEWFGVEADDGVKLEAVRVPATADRPHRPPVVFVPGWLEVKELHAPLALHLADAGHEVVIMDLRAHGGSGGDVCTFSHRETRDLTLVIAAARQRGWLADPRDTLITGGVSTGAVTALIHAANPPEPAPAEPASAGGSAPSDAPGGGGALDSGGGGGLTSGGALSSGGVLALSPFFDLEDAVVFFRSLVAPKLCQPWLLRGMREASLRAGFNLDRIDTEAAVATLEMPVLFGTSDPASTASMADQVQRLVAAKNLGWKDYIEVPDTNHFTVAQNAWPHIAKPFETMCDEATRAPA